MPVGRGQSLWGRRRNPDRLGQGGLAGLRRAPWSWARIGRGWFWKGLVGQRNVWHSSFSQGERVCAERGQLAPLPLLQELSRPRRSSSATVRGYFGSTSRLPPGLPGGGITGVVPGSGSGGRAWGISGAMSLGGRITPPVRSSRSLKVSPGRLSDCVERGSCGPVGAGVVWADAPTVAARALTAASPSRAPVAVLRRD